MSNYIRCELYLKKAVFKKSVGLIWLKPRLYLEFFAVN